MKIKYFEKNITHGLACTLKDRALPGRARDVFWEAFKVKEKSEGTFNGVNLVLF